MKKFLFYLSVVCLFTSFVSCDNDDDDLISGEATIDGKEYAIKRVAQVHNGKYDRELNLEDIELLFFLEDGIEINLHTLVDGSEKLKAGTYYMADYDSYKDLTIREADFYLGNRWYDMDEVKMSVSINKDTYTISIEGEYENEGTKKISIDYKGIIDYTTYVVKPNGQGTLIYDGETYNLNTGKQNYYGLEYGTYENIDLSLYNEEEEVEIYFEMFVNSGNKLVAGTYTYSEDEAPMSFTNGYISTEDFEISIEDGEVKISVSGNTYTISGEGEDEDGIAYSFNYKGELKWFDDAGDRNDAPQRARASAGKKR